jgi:hypothetical protein
VHSLIHDYPALFPILGGVFFAVGFGVMLGLIVVQDESNNLLRNTALEYKSIFYFIGSVLAVGTILHAGITAPTGGFTDSLTNAGGTVVGIAVYFLLAPIIMAVVSGIVQLLVITPVCWLYRVCKEAVQDEKKVKPLAGKLTEPRKPLMETRVGNIVRGVLKAVSAFCSFTYKCMTFNINRR